MSKPNYVGKIKMASMEDMLGGNKTPGISLDDVKDSIVEIPLSELHTFRNHPFRVVDDEKMEETVESIKEQGVLVPILVRPLESGGYEIISGHRRKRASELAELKTIPAVVKALSDDEAIQIMVDANIQRENILPSEKARAYSMKYEAMKHQGIVGAGDALDTLGEDVGENRKTVQRYICLARLSEDLLQMVDEKKLGLGQGIDFSFLDESSQKLVFETIQECKCNVSGVQSAQIKSLYKEGKISTDRVWQVLSNQKPKPRKVVFNSKKLDSYFTPNLSNEEIEEVIIGLLEEWKEKGGSDIDG